MFSIKKYLKNLKPSLFLGLRAALASLLAALVALRLGMDYPIYAVIAAIVVTDNSPHTTWKAGWIRLLGNIIGALLGAVIGIYLGHNPFWMALGVLFAVLLCDLINLKDAQKTTGYITGIVILFHGDSPWQYAWDRFLETSIGLVSAILVGLAVEWILKRTGKWGWLGIKEKG
jgi:uncharacterized membrane protein YgaE (UPF0421/DUF939 family)